MIPTLLTDSVTSNLERALYYALLWGLEGVELRTVGGPHDRVPNVNERKLRGQLRDSDMPVVAITPGMFEGDVNDRAAWLNELASFDETLAFCERIDCPRIVVSSFSGPIGAAADTDVDAVLDLVADPLHRAATRSENRGVQLCILNSAGGLIRTGAHLNRLLATVGVRCAVAAWHPMEAMVADENPVDGIDALAGRIGLVRCSNGSQVGNGWAPRAIDRGAIEWPDQIDRLRRMAFDGPVSLEVRVDPRAKSGLRESMALIDVLRTVR